MGRDLIKEIKNIYVINTLKCCTELTTAVASPGIDGSNTENGTSEAKSDGLLGVGGVFSRILYVSLNSMSGKTSPTPSFEEIWN